MLEKAIKKWMGRGLIHFLVYFVSISSFMSMYCFFES